MLFVDDNNLNHRRFIKVYGRARLVRFLWYMNKGLRKTEMSACAQGWGKYKRMTYKNVRYWYDLFEEYRKV